MFSIVIIAGVTMVAMDYYFAVPFLSVAIQAIIWTAVFLLTVLLALPSIFIRKDCSECQLGFHIIAHERNHLLLDLLDEDLVEEETLRLTRNQLIPILLSSPKLCKDCLFPLRKTYSQATFDYLKEKQKGNSEA
jgi:hypothetical protein